MTDRPSCGHRRHGSCGQGENVDVAEPPRIVLETPEACADAPRLEGLLRGALARARAPGDAWSVDVKMERTDAHELRARAGITDASGAQVARRVLSNHAADCEGLARAVGVWASLVFEAELAREHSAKDDSMEPNAARDRPRETDGTGAGATSDVRDGGDDPGAGAGTTARSSGSTTGEPPRRQDAKKDAKRGEGESSEVSHLAAWRLGGSPQDPASPESDESLRDDGRRRLEVGSGAFVMARAAGTLGGLSIHAALGIPPGPFVRPAIFVGETWTPDSKTNQNSTWTAARVDGCVRLPLSKGRQRGFQLDPCLGGEVGNSTQTGGKTKTGLSFGPAIDVRKQLGNSLAATLRGVGEVTVAGGERLIWNNLSARLELALSCGIW
jgi:hypothetical protein